MLDCRLIRAMGMIIIPISGILLGIYEILYELGIYEILYESKYMNLLS